MALDSLSNSQDAPYEGHNLFNIQFYVVLHFCPIV